MRITQELAMLIARMAISEPYRQIDTMGTREFASWLENRGISLHWQAIHHLWAIGVLHPVAVLEPVLPLAGNSVNRFVPIDAYGDVLAYVDLGNDVEADVGLVASTEIAPDLASAVLWHPFQLWQLHSLSRRLTVPIAPAAALGGPDAYCDLVRLVMARLPERVLAYAQSDQLHQFLRVLALLLMAEPVVHTTIDKHVRTLPYSGESFDGYFSWRKDQDGVAMLQVSGLTLAQLEQWHHDIAVQAQLDDPLRDFRVLIRHANRDKRACLKGNALRSHDLYDAAEVVRRYGEQFHMRRFQEEDDAIYGPQGPTVKRRLYGSERTADFDRTVFRRIARAFGVDPQARTTWFLEGDTEEAFVRQICEHFHIDLITSGIDIVNLGGVGGLHSDRLRGLLERLHREEVFAFVSIDRDDRSDHLRQLKQYASRNLLPAGYKIWEPDFEEANFSLEELAQIANQVAASEGIQTYLSADSIKNVMQEKGVPAGEAVARLLKAERCYKEKGGAWGRALADWAGRHVGPPEIVRGVETRPVVSALLKLLRGQESHYASTLDEYEVSSDGQLVPRAKQAGNATDRA